MKKWLLTSIIGLGLIGGAFVFDDPTRAWINAHQPKWLVELCGAVSDYGDWPELMLLGVVLLGVGWFLRNKSWRRTVVILMVSSTLSGTAVNAVRLTSGRTRPSNTEVEQGFYGLRHDERWLIGRNKFNSFPSGHVATAAGFFFPLLFLLGWVAAPVALLPLGMAFSRMFIGAHHFSDVIASLFVAGVVSFLVVRWANQRLVNKSGESAHA